MNTVQTRKGIDKDILFKSMAHAQEIFDLSPILREYGADPNELYVERDSYFQDMLGEKGHVSFHPKVKTELTDIFITKFQIIKDCYGQKYMGAPSGSDEELKNNLLSRLCTHLLQHTKDEDLINNSIPPFVKEIIEDWKTHHNENVNKVAKMFSSPKLSKMLVKLSGQDSEVVKWYTTRCPKEITEGVNTDYVVHVSTLPHHVAGSAYYGAYNHGGKRWIEGYKNTSCLDPKQNPWGEGMFSLMATMKESTLAVAWLSHANDNDIFNPIYQSRVLLRIVDAGHKKFMFACRNFWTSNTTMHTLNQGLKNEFGDVVIAQEVRRFQDVERDLNMKRFRTRTKEEPIVTADDLEVLCPDCDYGCDDCDGDGRSVFDGVWKPYIDDGDLVSFDDDDLVFRLSRRFLEEEEILKPKEEEKRDYSLLGA